MEITQLSVLAYANNFTLWHYKHQGPHAEVIEDGFFDDAHTLVNKSDLILINCQDANTSVWVTASEDNNVIVAENLLPNPLVGGEDVGSK